ncbi:MAG: hypothetical protein R3B48_24255 [Kofleriaceae bacterium]
MNRRRPSRCSPPPLARGLASLLMLAALPACFTNGDPDDSRSGFHDVTVTWHIRNLDGSVKAACPPGYTTLVFHLYNVGYSEPPDSLVMMPCTPEGSVTRPLATAGRLIDEETRDQGVHAYYPYAPQKDIWVDVTEATRSAYAAVSFLYHIENLAEDRTIDFDLYPDGGVGVVPVALSSALTGAPLTSCEVAGVDEIEYATRRYSDDTAPLVVGGSWPCTQIDPYFFYDPDGNSTLIDDEVIGSAHTRAFAPESYFVELRAKRAGEVVGTVAASVNIEGKNAAHKVNGATIPINDR